MEDIDPQSVDNKASEVLFQSFSLKEALFSQQDEENMNDQAFHANESALVNLFSEIAHLAGTDTSYQKMLGNGELIRFIANVLYSPYTSSNVGHQALRAWMRLCRRQELVKATANLDNLNSSEIHIVSLVPY
jgi:hypothetical protein